MNRAWPALGRCPGHRNANRSLAIKATISIAAFAFYSWLPAPASPLRGAGPSLADEDANVRRMAAFATGNVCNQRLDWSGHFTSLRDLLTDTAPYVPEAAAWALARLSRAKHDIGAAVPALVRVLADAGEYGEPRKEAAKALLNHARKSPAGRDQVRQAVAAVNLDGRRKEVKRFLDQLAEL